MGFLEYAWSVFFEKDRMKTKLMTSSKITFPRLLHDGFGFVCIFPEPTVQKEEDKDETISTMGYTFLAESRSKKQLAALFRAAVAHLGAHVLSSKFEDYEEWKKAKDPRLTTYVVSLIEDVVADSYVLAFHPDRLADLAFANALALRRLRALDRLINPATRMMAALLILAHTGILKIKREDAAILTAANYLDQFKKEVLQSFADKGNELRNKKLETAQEIYESIEGIGAVVETPFLPHTEEIGKCSVFSPSYSVDPEIASENEYDTCLKFLGGKAPTRESVGQSSKIAEAEASQVFDSWRRQSEKDQKLLAKYSTLLPKTVFKSVEIPDKDYTEFLRINSSSKSESRRLIESLLVARDALDEDPNKIYGVLDLQEVIQVIASKSPRMDVFMLDENLSKSYSWMILLDASRSMKHLRDFALEVFIILGEVANELLLDSTAWGMYAFNDRFWVIKDPKERYNARVKSRIGGISFDGFTYMPDALSIVGQIIKARNENMRLITVISDGWLNGYQDMSNALTETLSMLGGKNISLMGIGARSRRMEFFFKSNCTVYTLRDLTRKFSNLYMGASRIAVET